MEKCRALKPAEEARGRSPTRLTQFSQGSTTRNEPFGVTGRGGAGEGGEGGWCYFSCVVQLLNPCIATHGPLTIGMAPKEHHSEPGVL